ncbi:MAG: PAS domain-containing sensor histidine kinase [Planctomycetota bacterium]
MIEKEAQARAESSDPNEEAGAAKSPGAEVESARLLRESVRTRQLARLGALFAGFAHEIRNPLSTIGLNLQLVAEELRLAESPREQRIARRITVVESEVRRLQDILEQFLGFVRVPELRRQPVALGALLRSIVEFVEPEMHERSTPFRLLCDDTDLTVDLDPDQFRAVLVNLLRNAMDATAQGGEVIVAARAVGDEVLVQVIDTGIGMTPEVKAQAFTPYFSTKKHGTGLGLPTARRVVEQHGGRLQLDSEVGRGTAFTIHLPRRTDTGSATEAAS